MMNNDKTLVIAYMITVAIDRGLPALEKLIQGWKQDDPELADWEKLARSIKDPKEFLK